MIEIRLMFDCATFSFAEHSSSQLQSMPFLVKSNLVRDNVMVSERYTLQASIITVAIQLRNYKTSSDTILMWPQTLIHRMLSVAECYDKTAIRKQFEWSQRLELL
jgi:hypothetical protein